MICGFESGESDAFTALICWVLALACMNTMNCTSPFQRAVECCTAARTTNAEPTRASDTATVTTEASVSVRLRRRLLVVSRAR